jgi:hypothetical protein
MEGALAAYTFALPSGLESLGKALILARARNKARVEIYRLERAYE